MSKKKIKSVPKKKTKANCPNGVCPVKKNTKKAKTTNESQPQVSLLQRVKNLLFGS